MAFDGYNDCETEASPYGFDEVSDADSNLSRSADAVHDGTYGLAIEHDTATVAQGQLNLDAVDQASCIASFWYNPNGAGAGLELTAIAKFADGANASIVWLYCNASATNILTLYKTDTEAANYGTTLSLSDDWHHILVSWKASTGAGNDDGILRVRVDGVISTNLTNLDTDTLDVDNCQFGNVICYSASPSGTFYMDEIYIDPTETHYTPFAGSFVATGAVSKKGKRSLAGAFVATGAIAKKVARALAGPGVFTGTITRKVKKVLAGALVLTGAVTKKTKRALAGALALTGVLAKFKLWILFARFRDYFLNAPQRFTISSNEVQMTARYRDYKLTGPEKK